MQGVNGRTRTRMTGKCQADAVARGDFGEPGGEVGRGPRIDGGGDGGHKGRLSGAAPALPTDPVTRVFSEPLLPGGRRYYRLEWEE